MVDLGMHQPYQEWHNVARYVIFCSFELYRPGGLILTQSNEFRVA
jgi:hypothetical protein